MKTKRNLETIVLSIIIIIMFLLGQPSNAQISIKNDTLHFDSTIKKGSVIWVSSEYGQRLIKFTIRSNEEVLTASKKGWAMKRMHLPKGAFRIEYLYKGKTIKTINYISK